MRTTWIFVLAVAGLESGLAAPCTAQTSTTAARYSAIAIYAPPTWFESYASPALISPTGTRALNYAGGTRLVDLTTGRESPDPAWTGLDVVSSVTFGPDGAILLWGRIGSVSGLFRRDSTGRPALIALPPGAGDPQWSPDGRKIAVMQLRSRDSALAAGEPGRLRSYAITKPAAFAWLPTNESLLVLTTDDAARSTLVRLDLESGRTTVVATDLDAGPWPRRLGVSSDGRRAYVALASAHVPAAAVRNRPSRHGHLAFMKSISVPEHAAFSFRPLSAVIIWLQPSPMGSSSGRTARRTCRRSLCRFTAAMRAS